MVLKSTSFELGNGRTNSSAFLLDMNQVFEDFVVIALRDALQLSERVFPQAARGRRICLDKSQRIRLLPDISWWDGKCCSFVGDVKYKRISVAGVKHPDIYQLLAYTTATDLPGGLLVYAAGESVPVRHEVVHAGKQLEIMTLDLKGTPQEILATVNNVANRILELRTAAIMSRPTPLAAGRPLHREGDT